MLIDVYTDFPERLQPKVVVYAGEAHLPLTISRRRMHNDGLLLAFEDYLNPEQVGQFRNQILYSSRADAPKLADGEYYQFELLGLLVEDESGKELGRITEVIETGANDVYVVTDAKGHEVLLPAIHDVVLDLDMDKKLMRVHLLPGLLEAEE